MKDLYQILGISRNASMEDIKKAYRQLALQYHPDRNPGDEDASARFKEVQQAYDTLSDPRKKSEYDSPALKYATRRGKPFTSVFNDMFSNLWDGEKNKGDDIIVLVELDFLSVLKGKKVEIKYQRRLVCKECENNTCSTCNGTGERVIRGTNTVVTTTCHVCSGTGWSCNRSCSTCEGQGNTGPFDEEFEFQIPPGVENGMVFVCKGKGDEMPTHNAGDLHIKVKVKDHPMFERLRDGVLMTEVPVTFTQLLKGGPLDVLTLKGKATVKLPSGTQPGTKFRLREMGLPIFNNSLNTYRRGDLFVVIKLEVPVKTEGRYAEIIEELSKLELEVPAPLCEAYQKKLEEYDGKSKE